MTEHQQFDSKADKYAAFIDGLESVKNGDPADRFSEHFHAVRTGSTSEHSNRHTAVIRFDPEADDHLTLSSVLTHERGSHYRDESNKPTVAITMSSHPFKTAKEYNRSMKAALRRRIRTLKEKQRQRRHRERQA